jgi:thiamine-phosphate pyrophosphorylase
VAAIFPRLHLITGVRPVETVRAVVHAATSLDAASRLAVQVRVCDDVSDRDAYALVLAVLEVCRAAAVMCLVNDRLDVALAADADGGHVGADDLPVTAARTVLGPAGVLGATCRTPAAATSALAAGATYLGVGPAYATTTKDGLPNPIGVTGVGAVAAVAGGAPIIAIGGVTADRVPPLRLAGAHGVAVVGAVANAADPARAAEGFLRVLS